MYSISCISSCNRVCILSSTFSVELVVNVSKSNYVAVSCLVRFADYIANGLFSESGFITNYHKQ